MRKMQAFFSKYYEFFMIVNSGIALLCNEWLLRSHLIAYFLEIIAETCGILKFSFWPGFFQKARRSRAAPSSHVATSEIPLRTKNFARGELPHNGKRGRPSIEGVP